MNESVDQRTEELLAIVRRGVLYFIMGRNYCNVRGVPYEQADQEILADLKTKKMIKHGRMNDYGERRVFIQEVN